VDDEGRALLKQATERLALREAIAHAPYATPSLVELLRRLAKLTPEEATVRKWREKLSECAAKPPEDPHLPGPRWAVPAGPGRLGLAVEAWARFAHAPVAQEDVRQTLEQHPGQFFTALGLALEALGMTPLDCELSPPREGWLARLPAVSRRGARAAWAVDLGATAVKALRLTRDGAAIRIDAAVHVPVPPQATENVGAFEEALRIVAEQVAQSPALVCVGLPGRWLLGRFFEMPAMNGRQWQQALRHEAQHQLPLALDELCWQTVVMAELPASTQGPAIRRVGLQAARRQQVTQLLEVCRSAGLAVARVQSEPLALHHAIQWELQGDHGPQPKAEAPATGVWVVDWGASQTNLLYTSADYLWFRTSSLGTDQWAQRLRASFAPRELAECRAWLVRPAAAPEYLTWWEAATPALEALEAQIQRCIASFPLQQAPRPQRLIGLGGGFQSHGVVAYLRRPAE
jgi:Tfp pilus assembly PilM family ATPase